MIKIKEKKYCWSLVRNLGLSCDLGEIRNLELEANK